MHVEFWEGPLCWSFVFRGWLWTACAYSMGVGINTELHIQMQVYVHSHLYTHTFTHYIHSYYITLHVHDSLSFYILCIRISRKRARGNWREYSASMLFLQGDLKYVKFIVKFLLLLFIPWGRMACCCFVFAAGSFVKTDVGT